MTRLVQTKLLGEPVTTYINVDLVTHFREVQNDKGLTHVYFGKDDHVTVQMTASNFAALAKAPDGTR
jgi:hypothetical protein